MTPRHIVFYEVTDASEPGLKASVAAAPELAGAAIIYSRETLSASTASLARDADVVSVFVKSAAAREVIDALPKAKLIVTRSTGFDHIDVAYAASKGIRVANVPAYGSRTVAEFAFALILGLSRKTFSAALQVKTGGGFGLDGLMGFDLQGKTIGVVGTGRIGLNAIQIAKGFDMKVLAFDAFPNMDKARELGFAYVSLDELLAESDVVTLHVPYNKDTHYLINMDNYRRFKRGAILVNTARGEVCETEAILSAVNEGVLGAIGLDVVEGERYLAEMTPVFNELVSHPNVFITPHMAFFSKEAQQEIVQTSIDDIAAFIRGQEKNVVKG